MMLHKTGLSIGCMMLSAGAFAGVSGITTANNQVGMQIISTHVNYTETGNGQYGGPTGKLDSESGRVPGFALSVSTMQDLSEGGGYFEAEYSHSNGNTNYVGGLTGATSTPYGSVTGISSAVLVDYSGRFGKGFALGGKFMLTPYAELGRHEWDRGVNAGETYTNNYYGAGALAQYSPVDSLVISANAMLGNTYKSYIVVNGAFSGELGNSTIAKVGLGADYALAKNLHVNIGAEYTKFNYGISNVYPVGGGYVAWEPDSRTSYTTVKAGLGYAF